MGSPDTGARLPMPDSVKDALYVVGWVAYLVVLGLVIAAVNG